MTKTPCAGSTNFPRLRSTFANVGSWPTPSVTARPSPLTETATKYLLKSSPQYVGGMIRFESLLWSCWEKLAEAIRSGQQARPPNMYQDDPAETEIFIKAMDSLVNARSDAAVAANA